MLEDAILRVDIAYQAMVAFPRSRNFSAWTMRGKADVMVGRRAEAEAPIAIEARWDRGEPASMTWRQCEGALWRPVIAGNGHALTGPEAFEGLLAAEAAGQKIAEWPDYPFLLHSPGSGQHGRAPFQGALELEKGYRLQGDDHALSLARAQATAADDLMFIGDVLHRRSLPPVWTVGHASPVLHEPGEVRLAMPDYGGRGVGYATFPLDRKDDALAFAAEAVERVGGLGRLMRIGHERPAMVMDAGDGVEYIEMPFPGEAKENLARSLLSIEEGLSVGKFGEFGRGFRKAFSDFAVAAGSCEDAGDDEAARLHMGEAYEAMGRMIEHEDPEWGHTWPRIGEVMNMVRLQVWLHAFDERRTELDRDMEAVGDFLP